MMDRFRCHITCTPPNDAVRLLEAMGVSPARGAVRLSFVHYTTAAEVAGLIDALESALK